VVIDGYDEGSSVEARHHEPDEQRSLFDDGDRDTMVSETPRDTGEDRDRLAVVAIRSFR
jgi:hypothetical protein